MLEPRPSDIAISRLTAEAASEAAALHSRAFPRHFLTSLGNRFLTLYYASVTSDPTSIAVAASQGERLIGLCVGSVDPAGFYSRLFRRKWFSFGLAAVPAAARRPSCIPRLLRARSHGSSGATRPDTAGLFSIAVDPTRQGTGVGHDLLGEFVRIAAERGACAVELDTDECENDAVNRFYLSAGFVVAESYVTQEGRRMLKYRQELVRQ